MGPSHPATHGTIKFNLVLDGESITSCDTEIGYLQRGFEKMCEQGTWTQCIPYTDRLNYASPLLNNVGFALAVEDTRGRRGAGALPVHPRDRGRALPALRPPDVHLINRFSCTKLARWQIFFYIVIFTMAIGAFWEIYEYLMDTFLGSYLTKTLQHGLDDTMIDLILDLIGGLIVAFFGTWYIRKKTLDELTSPMVPDSTPDCDL